MLFETPILSEQELLIVDRISAMRMQMRHVQGNPMRWFGTLRRNALARAIQGSNSIEGYNVSKEDAIAAVEMEEPVDAELASWQAISGYRDAMTYVLQLTDDPSFTFSEGYLRSLHFMMLRHDLTKHPGNWRLGPIYVNDESAKKIVYTAPDRVFVESLMAEFIEDLNRPSSDTRVPDIVKAAMAHLNFVMIHPFADGNGRMGRCIQTMVLSRQGIVEPQFCSVEEYLGRFTRSYYDILGEVGEGKWNPQNDARPWVRYMLKAHFMQASLLVWRMNLLGRLWSEVETLVHELRLPERVISPLVDAATRYKVRNAIYRKSADISENLASRDLKILVDHHLLDARGENRGRHYVASTKLLELRDSCYEDFAAGDPFEDNDKNLYLPGMEP
jgi:Fic family protein